MANDGTVKIGVDVNEKEFKSGLSKLGSMAEAAFVGVSAAAGAASTAIGKLAKDSTVAYASYEQLVGGVETLFGESADAVISNAKRAFENAGLSANEYMETVTSFAASLLQSLDGDTYEAMESAEKAIVDMADNANKMGTDMASIQNAYQGFAKQNYTMLDNLKLGFGGTKDEMVRLLSEAEKLSGKKFDLSSFADIVDAIHIIQEEMGISGLSATQAAMQVKMGAMTQEEAYKAMGTTAKEANETIEGSLNAMRAAWQNLITGIGDENSNLDGLMEDFVRSFEIAAENLIPRLEIILSGMGDLVGKLAPIIAEKFPGMMETLLPPLVHAAGLLIQGLATALPDLLSVIMDVVHQAIDSIGQSIAEEIPFLSGLFENLDSVVTAAAIAFVTLKTATMAYQAASGVAKVIQMLTAATEGQTIAQAALNAVMNANPFVLIATVIATVIAAVVSLTLASEDFRNALSAVFDAIGQGIQWLIGKISSLIEWFEKLFGVSSSAGDIDIPSGGGSSGSASRPRARVVAAPANVTDGNSEEGTSITAGTFSRAATVRALESAIPNVESRVALATAGMAPAAGYAPPPPVHYGGGADSRQPVQQPTHQTINIKFTGDLAQLARVLQPVIDAETHRIGPGV